MGYALDRCRPPSWALPCPSLLLQPPFSPGCLEGPPSEPLGRSLRLVRGRSFPDVSGVVQARLPKGIAALIELPAASRFVSGPLWSSARSRPRASALVFQPVPLATPASEPSPVSALDLTLALCARTALALASMLAPGQGSSGAGFRHCPGLVVAYGRALSLALRSIASVEQRADLAVPGLERQCVNDLALSLPWTVDAVWDWPRPVHINILEASVLCRLYKDIALKRGPCRFVAFCDSYVALSSLGKGRSSSASLRHAARRSSMTCLAAGLYPGSVYTPTRLMPADHPTRDHELPPLVPGLGPSFWTFAAVKQDTLRPRLRRWASSWVRLALLLRPCLHLLAPDSVGCAGSHLDFRAFVHSRGFDSTKGFPGEGPLLRFGDGSLFALLFLSGLLRRPSLCLGFSVFARAAAMEAPRVVKQDAARALFRTGVVLRVGRPVQRETQLRRDKLKALFEKWLETFGQSFEWFLTRSRSDPDFATRSLYAMASTFSRQEKRTAATRRR